MTSSKLALALSIAMAFAVGGSAYAGDYCPPGETAKGNNGWGQEKHGGSDGTNNGSFSGATADTKSASTER
ncbi:MULTISPECIES: hypothetical protein [Rhizobium]|uniref:Glycine rich protein n=1 Tax=Rhizobium aethiopicum TaxID=1138170 RepID=A0A1C3Y5H0_9HYPH|nr:MULTISPECIES: hypothetical protein [Rhizobium]SCB59675.1 hypothetical protein GA0061105_10831 [Rhizobium aethiopicum]